MIGLTSKQSQLLRFIKDRMANGGVSPSFEEMRAGIDVASKSAISRLITALEERGHIRRMHFRDRAIELVDPLESVPTAALLAEIRKRGFQSETAA